jgi:hypothetical protein
MDPLKKKRITVIIALAIIIVLAIAALVIGVIAFRHNNVKMLSPVASSTVATGPGTVAWEAHCIYANNLQTAEKDPLNVCSLDLLSQNLTAIPPVVFTMTNLEYLNLANNKITNVPADIGNLTHLKWLYLNQNAITSLPDTMNKLVNLQLLAIEQDGITALPSDMAGMANLHSIIVQGNPLPLAEVTRIKTVFAKASVIY